jgi:hypothetical protein
MDARTKYKEAVSAMQAICNELADIEDDNEYREDLKFVLDHWRNVRQRKSVRSSHAEETKSGQNQSGQRGDVAFLTSRPRTRSLSLLNTPSELVQGVGRTGGSALLGYEPPVVTPQVHDEGIGTQATDASQLSPAHSLFSAELGRIAIVNATVVQVPAPIMARQPSPRLVASMDKLAPKQDDDFEDQPLIALRIRINPKAAKSGRPRLDRKQREAEDRQKRATFNASDEHRRALGEVTLIQLAEGLSDERSTLEETLRCVRPISVKFD